MDSNTHSGSRPARLAALAAAVDELAAQDLVGQTDAVLANQVLELRRLLDRLEGHWLQTLAAVDGRGAAGADQGLQVGSTAAWLRGRLRLGAGAAAGWVRTARALYRGPLTQTGQALAAGELSTAHARCWPTAPTTCRTRSPPRPNGDGGGSPPAGPTRLRRVLGHLRRVADPEGAQGRAERQHQRRACGCRPPSRAWSPLRAAGARGRSDGAGRPGTTGPPQRRRRHPQRRPAPRRRPGRGGPPHPGSRAAAPDRRGPPQLTVTVDLDSLLGPGGLGGEVGGAEPLDPEACRRLACDGAVTRVLVTRHPTTDHPDHGLGLDDGPGGHDHQDGLEADAGLAAQLRAAARLLPPALGGAPAQPLEVGRASRVVTAAQRAALVVRDGGCAVAGCHRPPAWCEAHHLRHWLHGGPTDLANLALVCRAHHRAVHEGWLAAGPRP
jgi:HNH endonuclease